MSDPLDDVLRLVAEGRLTAEEAAPVIDALQAAAEATDDAAAEPVPGAKPRAVRIEVSEAGRRVVDLRVPIALGRLAIDRVPGLSSDHIARIRDALDHGMTGPILVVDEGADGNRVRIVLE